jgi:hypothetical protein
MIEIALAKVRAVKAYVHMPASRVWHAFLTLEDETQLSGSVRLALGTLELQGAIVTGGPYTGTGEYLVMGGAGKWGTELPSKTYGYNEQNLVRLSTVLNDAARECGESISGIVERDVGPAFMRPKQRAAMVLEQLLGNGWYVDDAGATQATTRPTGTAQLEVTSWMRSARVAMGVTDDPTRCRPGQTLTIDGTNLLIEDLVFTSNEDGQLFTAAGRIV